MSKSRHKVTRRADETVADQLKLTGVLSSLSAAPTHSAQHDEKEWDKEIDQRLEDLRAGKIRGVSLDQLKKRITVRVTRLDC